MCVTELAPGPAVRPSIVELDRSCGKCLPCVIPRCVVPALQQPLVLGRALNLGPEANHLLFELSAIATSFPLQSLVLSASSLATPLIQENPLNQTVHQTGTPNSKEFLKSGAGGEKAKTCRCCPHPETPALGFCASGYLLQGERQRTLFTVRECDL